MVHRPIVDWTAEQTFECMAEHGVRPNPLYSMGMKRVGCSPCINCGKDELLEIAMRFPAEVDRVEQWERLVSDVCKRGASSFFHLDAEDEAETPEEIFARASIRNFVAWSKTSRGGKQLDLERMLPRSACSSVYGLCE